MQTGMIRPEAHAALLQQIRIELVYSGRLALSQWEYDLCSPFWRLYVNDRAGGWIRFGSLRWSLAPAQVYLIPAWVRFTTGLSVPVRHDFIHFELHGLPPSLHRALFPRPIRLEPDAALSAAVVRWQDGLGRERGLAGFAWAQSLVAQAVAHAVDRLPPREQSEAARYLEFPSDLLPALELIERRLERPPANAELAAACGLSEDHFIRVFRRSLGLSPARYGQERRVAIAARWLVATERSIDEIAARAGFSDRFHFSRVFTRRFGSPPAAYRRMHRAER